MPPRPATPRRSATSNIRVPVLVARGGRRSGGQEGDTHDMRASEWAGENARQLRRNITTKVAQAPPGSFNRWSGGGQWERLTVPRGVRSREERDVLNPGIIRNARQFRSLALGHAARGSVKVEEHTRVRTEHHGDFVLINGDAATVRDAGAEGISKCSPRRREREPAVQQAVLTEDEPQVGRLTWEE